MKTLRRVRRGEAVFGLVVLAGMIAAAFFSTGGGGGPETDTYATDDFRSGGYAAFFMLLQREGVTAQSFDRRPAELDASIDTLIVAYPAGGAESAARLAPDRAALRAWVAAGGRLISLGNAQPLAELVKPKTGKTAPQRVDTATPKITRYRRGEIVIVSDARRFDNANLALGDNARAAFALAQPRRAGAVVAFDATIHGVLIDRTWWEAMEVPERVALAGIVLAILVALAGGALRLGPPVTLREAREPASDEFIAAVAALYQRSGARRAAIALLAHGARHASGEAAERLRELADRLAPADRDVIAGAKLARTIREGQ